MAAEDVMELTRAWWSDDRAVERARQRARAGLRVWERAVVDSYMTRGGSVLDVGCGAGREAIELASLGFEVTGIDVAEPVVAVARELTRECRPPVELYVLDAADLPFETSSFDSVVLWSQALANVGPAARREQVLRECVRCMRPGGVLSLSVHDADLCLRLVQNDRRAVLDRGEPGDVYLLHDAGQERESYWHYYTRAELAEQLARAGLAEVHVENATTLGEDDWGMQILVATGRGQRPTPSTTTTTMETCSGDREDRGRRPRAPRWRARLRL